MTTTSGSPQVQWRRLQASDAPMVFALHQRVTQHQPAGFVRCDSLQHFEQLFQAGDAVYAAFEHGSGMVAYGVFSKTSPACNDLARLLGLTQAQRQAFAVLDGSGVLAPWRGQGLQEQLIRIRMEHGLRENCKTLGATAAPENAWSLNNLLQAGFHVHGAAVMYGGMRRLVLCHRPDQNTSGYTEFRDIVCTDFEAQATVLGEGWRGHAAMMDSNRQMHIRYGR
jgi:hypothetical protein